MSDWDTIMGFYVLAFLLGILFGIHVHINE